MRPYSESERVVKSWLANEGLEHEPASPFGDMIVIKISVGHANDLFAAEFADYEHIDTGRVVARTLAYSLPDDVKHHVEFVDSAVSCVFPLR